MRVLQETTFRLSLHARRSIRKKREARDCYEHTKDFIAVCTSTVDVIIKRYIISLYGNRSELGVGTRDVCIVVEITRWCIKRGGITLVVVGVLEVIG